VERFGIETTFIYFYFFVPLELALIIDLAVILLFFHFILDLKDRVCKQAKMDI